MTEIIAEVWVLDIGVRIALLGAAVAPLVLLWLFWRDYRRGRIW